LDEREILLKMHKSPAQFLHSEKALNYAMQNQRSTKSISLVQDDKAVGYVER
jgi:hypothetical protein